MTKVLFVAAKKAAITDDEFAVYWQQVHAPLVSVLPGLRRHVINIGNSAASSTAAACDGVGELWFESEAAWKQALASPEGRAVLADSPNFCAPSSGWCEVEESEAFTAA